MTRAGSADVVVIGGGHNGLVCAAYLAAGGLKVHVLERRAVVGGAAFTEEFHPGFRNSLASYTVSLLHPKVIRGEHSDLLLAGTLEEMKRRPRTESLVIADTGHCPMLMDDQQTGAIRRFLLG